MWSDIDNAEYVCEKLSIPGCQILIRVDREVYGKDGLLESHDVRYFLSSLDPGTVMPSDLQKLVRDHWQVENCLHFVKDRWWEEDRHDLKYPSVNHPLIELTNAALSLLRLLQCPGESLREVAENFHYSPRKALQTHGFNKN